MERMIDLSEATAPLLHSDPGRVAYARFDADPDLLVIPVVNGDRVPVGLVERTRFALKMAGQFGREVFAGRPVSLSMDSEAVVIDGEMPLTEFISRHLQDRHLQPGMPGQPRQVTQRAALAALPRNRLGKTVANVRAQHTDFVAAIDLLFTGV